MLEFATRINEQSIMIINTTLELLVCERDVTLRISIYNVETVERNTSNVRVTTLRYTIIYPLTRGTIRSSELFLLFISRLKYVNAAMQQFET